MMSGSWLSCNRMLTKTAATGYSACMRPFLFVTCCTILFSPSLAVAENSVLPPPSMAKSATPAADDAVPAGESAPNLNEELKAPDADSNVDVRSYKRKDGATVSEYSLNGQIYEVKIQPAGGLPAYYLYLNKTGHFERRRPGAAPFITPPSWILKEF